MEDSFLRNLTTIQEPLMELDELTLYGGDKQEFWNVPL